MGMIAVLLTSIYSTRLLRIIFLNNIPSIVPFTLFKMAITQWTHKKIKKKNYILEDVEKPMFISMLFLLICSIIVGYFFSDLFIGFASNSWLYTFNNLSINYNFINIEFVPIIIKNLPIFFSLFALYITSILLNIIDLLTKFDIYKINQLYNNYLRNYLYNFSSFSYHAAYFNLIYNNIFIRFAKNMYLIYIKSLDRGFFEYIGPYGIFLLFRNIYYYYYNWFYVIISFTLYTIILFIIFIIFIFLLLKIPYLCLLFYNISLNSFFLICFIFLTNYLFLNTKNVKSVLVK